MGTTTCPRCSGEYPDTVPSCPKCGEPSRRDSLSVHPGEVVTGKAVRIKRGPGIYRKDIAISLKVPGLFILAILLGGLALFGLVVSRIFRWIGGRGGS